MADKVSKFTVNDNDRLIVSALKGTDGLTIAEVNEKLGSSLLPVHFNHARTGGFIEVIGAKEVTKYRPAKVHQYSYLNSDIACDAKGNPCEYSASQMAILEAAQTMEGEFTLAELAKVMGVEKVAPGSITSLVNRGNLAKSDEERVIERASISSVSIWGYLKDAE